MNIISREEAIKVGATRYYTGKPCKNNHVAERTVSNFTCLTCQREKAKRDYINNPQKWINRRLDYYIKNKQSELQKMKAYYESNAEYQTDARKERYFNNAQECRAYSRKWAKENPEKRKRSNMNRKNAVLLATPSWYGELDEFVLEQAYLLVDLRKHVTGMEWQVDHMIPLQAKLVCGLHVWNNFQVIPAVLNNSKRNKLKFVHPFEWIGFNGS